MALAITESTRNNRLDEITAAIDAGAGAGLLRIYDGTRPATGGATTTLLAELTFSDPSFPAASGGTMTANAITSGLGVAAGTATWFRVVDSNSLFVLDGDCGVGGSDLNFTGSADVSIGITVSVDTFVLTAGNP